MKLATILIFVALVFYSNNAEAQWTNYNTDNSGIVGNSAYAIAAQSDGRIWIGDGFAGVSEFDGGNWTVYDMDNSGMPINGTLRLEIAPNGDKWIATNTEGIAVFDDNNWTIYNTGNTGQNINFMQGEIGFNINGDAWIAPWSGLIHFDGNTWTNYYVDNSNIQEGWNKYFATEDYETFWSTRTGWGQDPYLFSFNVSTGDTASYLIPGNYRWTEVFNLDFDSQGNIWIICLDGLFKFDGANWTHFHTSNSDIPADDLRVLLIDSNDNIWLGTFGVGDIYGDGLIKYDGNIFTQWTMDNSGLPNYSFADLDEDIYGNIWIAHNGGGATMFDHTTASVDDPDAKPISVFQLNDNYPNPFNAQTTIQYSLSEPSDVVIEVYDLLGRKVQTLTDDYRQAGIHTISFDASDLSSGVYFYRLQAGNMIETKRMVLLK